MNNGIKKSILAGIIGTAIMTMVMKVAPLMGMPKMSPPSMLAGMLGLPIVVGWLMHFMIGISFAFAYTFVFKTKVNLSNIYIKGIIFGFAAFVFAQIMMKAMGAMMPMPVMEGPMILNFMGSLIGHIVFGVAVAIISGNKQS